MATEEREEGELPEERDKATPGFQPELFVHIEGVGPIHQGQGGEEEDLPPGFGEASVGDSAQAGASSRTTLSPNFACTGNLLVYHDVDSYGDPVVLPSRDQEFEDKR